MLRRRKGFPSFVTAAASAAAALHAACGLALAQSSGNRILGLDVSAWQGNITAANWNTLKTTDNRGFVLIRSSRGGTTGYYDQNDSANNNGLNTFSQRYDDPYFIQNITSATNAGFFAGPYHFGRPDIIASTKNAGGIANTGADEADHFIQMAGPWMRPGYLLPVFDFEVGSGIRTNSQLAQFAIDFSNEIYAQKGIRPQVYINGSYASAMDGLPETSTLVSAMPVLWSARWPNQSNPGSIAVQTANPSDSYAPIYGPWDNSPLPAQPWTFWQYASTMKLQGISNGTASVDVDVVHGGTEYLKDFLVPALWMNDTSGQWTDLSNWNSGQTPVAPVQGPGQVARVGPLTLPAARLPDVNDTVVLDRPTGSITVTLASGAQNIRKLYVREPLNITGGSLTVNYVPVAESTPISAEFSANVSLGTGASFSAHTTQVDAGATFTLNGGSLTLNTINLVSGATPGKIVMGGDVAFTPLSNAAAAVINATGSGGTPSIDLSGAQRSFNVADGSATVDLAINVPINNGTLYKDGAGTLQLGAANSLAGTVTVNRGILLVTGSSQLGTTGVVTNMTVVTAGSGGSGFGGTVQLSNNVSYNLPLTVGGGGVTGVSLSMPGSTGALDNLSGTNTWSGTITLNGTGGSGTDPLENQIGARAGTLVLSGVLQDGPSAASWVKTGTGDVVLTGLAPNTYTGLTRLFGGRLIIEKDGALGGAGSNSAAGGNFFQNSLSASTLAFRAPASSPAGYAYTTWEVLNTEGTGFGGSGQIDNLGGANTFAGAIALAGPTMAGIIQSYLGVSAGSLEVQGGLYARGSTGARNITKAGSGTLILSGAGASAATPNPLVVPLDGSTFNLNAGGIELRGATPATRVLPTAMTWNVNSSATLTSSAGLFDPSAVNLAAGGSFVFAGGSTNIAALTITGGNATVTAGGAKTLRMNQLTLQSNGKLELGDNDAIVNYTSASPLGSLSGSAYTGVQGYIQSGRNGGAWNGSGGITTQQPSATTGLTTLAAAEASDVLQIAGTQTATWNGQSVDATSVLVMYTYAGDANLDGKINIDDYTKIDAGIIAGLNGYANGDFNYDGKISIDDYIVIDSNIAMQGPPLNMAAGLSLVVAVPEPSVLGVLTAILPLIRRRRRKVSSSPGTPREAG